GVRYSTRTKSKLQFIQLVRVHRVMTPVPGESLLRNVPEGRCDRSLARSAWDSATPKSRPVGYGVIRAGVRTDSMIGVTKFRIRKLKTFVLYDFWPTIQFLIQRWYLAGSGNGPLHRAAARTSSDTNLSRRVFSLP